MFINSKWTSRSNICHIGKEKRILPRIELLSSIPYPVHYTESAKIFTVFWNMCVFTAETWAEITLSSWKVSFLRHIHHVSLQESLKIWRLLAGLPEVRFPAGARISSPLHRVQTGSEAHPISYPMDTGGSFTRSKAAGAWS